MVSKNNQPLHQAERLPHYGLRKRKGIGVFSALLGVSLLTGVSSNNATVHADTVTTTNDANSNDDTGLSSAGITIATTTETTSASSAASSTANNAVSANTDTENLRGG